MKAIWSDPLGRTLSSAVAAVALGVVVFQVVSSQYLLHLISLALILSVLATSLNIVMGLSGLVSVAHGALFGIGAYTSVLLQQGVGLGFWLSVLAAVGAAALAGMLLGLLTLRLSGHYFAISSLAFAVVVVLIIDRWDTLTGGPRGLQAIPRPPELSVLGVFNVSLASIGGRYFMSLVAAVVTVVASAAIARSAMGRKQRAIKSSEHLAAGLGVNVLASRTVALTVSAGIAGLSGALFASYLGFFSPHDASFIRGFEAIMYVMIGGSGTVWGPLVGTFIVTLLPEYLRAIADYRLLILGVALILIVQRMPHGVVGAVQRLWIRLRRRLRGEAAA